MPRNLIVATLAAAGLALLPAVPSIAQSGKAAPKAAAPAQPAPAPAAPEVDTPEPPTPVALMIGGLQLASHPDIEIEAIEVAVAIDRITYGYKLRNKGTAELRLAASVELPPLAPSVDGTEYYDMATTNADDPVGLSIRADGTPVAAKVETRALALGIDRAADLKALSVPLIPFGPEVETALAGLAPDAKRKLAALGLLSPPDPAQAGLPVAADWTLAVTYAWEQAFAPGKTVTVTVGFKPVAGQFTLVKETENTIDEIKDEVCLAAPVVRSLKAKFPAKQPAGAAPAALPVVDLVVATAKPMRWLPAPAMTMTVDKPKAEVVAAFCGTDVKAASPTRSTARAPDPDETSVVRVLLFGATPP